MLVQLINCLTSKPASVFGLGTSVLEVGYPVDISLFDLATEKEIRINDFLSKATNAPFIGWKVKGTTFMTIIDEKVVYEKES